MCNPIKQHHNVTFSSKTSQQLAYEVGKEEVKRFKKAYVGTVLIPCSSYNMQRNFHPDGYFALKVTPLGANIFHLKENKDDELEALLEGVKDWLGQWFSEVRKWKEEDVDPERVTWLRCYGIPCHAWSIPFLLFLSSLVGKYICCDESTSDFSKLDVASILVRTACGLLINEVFKVMINNVDFRVRFMEETFGSSTKLVKKYSSILSDSDDSFAHECSS